MPGTNLLPMNQIIAEMRTFADPMSKAIAERWSTIPDTELGRRRKERLIKRFSQLFQWAAVYAVLKQPKY